MDALGLIDTHAAPPGSSVSGIGFANVFGSKKRFSVAPTNLESFLDAYCDLAERDEAQEEAVTANGGATRLGLSLAEVAATKTLPLIITMAFRFQISAEGREDPSLYGEDFIKACVNCLQDLMGHLLNISPKMSELICVVLESKTWHNGDNTYIRVRFHFPYAQVDAGYQQRIFKPALIKELRTRKVLMRMDAQPVGDWDIILEDIKDGVVPLYRSKDDASHAPLMVSHIFEYVRPEYVEMSDVYELQLKDIFNPTHHSFIHRNVIPGNFLLKADVDPRKWMPMFLSINFWYGVVSPKAALEAEPGTPGGSASLENDEEITGKEPLKMVRRLLPMLATSRFDTEPYWLDVGRVLYNISYGSDEGLNLWIQYSSKSTTPGRDKTACTNRYHDLRGSPLGVKTIAWYAREDSKSAYAEWHDAWCSQALREALTCIQDDVAEAVYRVFWLEYMCSGMTKNAWYKFMGNGLKPLDDAVYLRMDIAEVLVPLYKRRRIDICAQSANLGKDSDRKGIEFEIKQIGDLIKKLGTQGYRSSIVALCREKFYVPDFDKLRDADPTRTGWANCVIECCGDQAYPRPGKPEDFITMNTGIPYRRDLSWEHPLVVELMTWFKQAFPDEALLRFFIKDVSSMLLGRNAEKFFRAWVGDTNNSKSMMVKLFQACFGVYCVDFPADMLVKSTSRGGSGPSPEMAQARGAHIGIISEPDQSDDIQAGKLKRWTGGDRFFARMCNENGGSVDNFVKLIYMANRIPNIPGADEATKKRFLFFPFLSTWMLTGYPEDPEEQMRQRKFKMDPFFERRIPDLAYALVWVAVEYFSIYRAEGLKPPKIVIEYTERHWEENDPFLNFIHDRIAYAYKPDGKEFNAEVSLCASDIYPIFRQWYRDNYPGADAITQPIFTTHMKQAGRLGPQNAKKRWVAIRINTPSVEPAHVPALM